MVAGITYNTTKTSSNINVSYIISQYYEVVKISKSLLAAIYILKRKFIETQLH